MEKDLELIIDQSVVGHFYWTIVWLGAPGDLPRVMDYAHGPMPTQPASGRGRQGMRAEVTDAGEYARGLWGKQAKEALDYLALGRARGKVVVKMA